MDTTGSIQLIALLLLLALSAFFSSAETALTTVSRVRIRSLADEGNARAALLCHIVENPGKLLSTVLIGNNIVNISASSLMTLLTIRLFGSNLLGLGTGLLTLLVLLFGEITPKTMASLNSLPMAMAYAPVIYALMFILTPVISFVDLLENLLLRLMGVDPSHKSSALTALELRTLVEDSHQQGVLEIDKKVMLHNVFDLEGSLAKDIMIPRIDITFLDVEASYEELIRTFRKEWHTRFPVFRENVDEIVGIVNVKDLVGLQAGPDFSIEKIMRKPFFTYEYKPVSNLLEEMRRDSISFAIVLDEYGATAGVLTLEDIVEEIVGEIRDEFDGAEDEDFSVIRPDLEYLAKGSARLEEIDEALGLSFESEEYDSLAGFIIEKLDRLPFSGEKLTLEDGTVLTVERIFRNRILWVNINLENRQVSEDKDV